MAYKGEINFMKISKRFYIFLSLLLAFTLIITGCSTQDGDKNTIDNEGLQIVTSLSIIADIASNIIGNRGNVSYLVPIGEEPEEYEPSPSDFRQVSDADVLFVNGLNMEGWL